MKWMPPAVILTFLAALLLNCSDKDKNDYALSMNRIGSDTVSVVRDSSSSLSFYINSKPGLDVDNITSAVYDKENNLEERIQLAVASYPGLQNNARVTMSVYAESECPAGEYSLRCSASNGRVGNTISYILNVR